MKKVLIVFGTRPEAIKMALLVKEFLKEKNSFITKVCVTSQHRQMLDQVLDFFEIQPDFDLDIMRPNQDLYSITSDIIIKLKDVFNEYKPDYVFVHGDTSTTMATSIAAFYAGAKVCHVEAGLRTYNKWSPFPEEINRQIVSRIADYNYAPTEESKRNLLKENIAESSIIVTGNTVIDSLLYSSILVDNIQNNEIELLKETIDTSKQIILVTGHRRENHGEGFENICKALNQIAEAFPNLEIIYPVHLNPNVQEPVYRLLKDVPNIKLIDPLSYPAFVWLMNKSHIIITDSGGVQEEAPSLGKPVLVLRNNTERPEAVTAGTVILVGTDTQKIVNTCSELLINTEKYSVMSALHNPYGDGLACARIVNHLKSL